MHAHIGIVSRNYINKTEQRKKSMNFVLYSVIYQI